MSDTVSAVVHQDLAMALLSLAFTADMPLSYWSTDHRIALACKALDIEPRVAFKWIEAWIEGQP